MNAAATITLSYPEPDLAVLTFDLPGKSANVLSISILDELEKHLDVLQPREDLAGLIITSGKPGTFIAGADLREFAASIDIPAEKTFEVCQRGQKLLGRLSQCPFVTVTAIDGTCVGGGAEVAVWCDRRIMSDNPGTEFGFPEVKLGLFPGWGGTARTPRIVGLANAVEIITSGESIDGEAARLMGLVSDVVPVEALFDAAVRLVRDEQATKQYLEDRRRWHGPLNISETELGFLGATASAIIQQQTKGQYPAPPAALEVLLGAAGEDVDTACKMEADGMSKLFGSPVNASLLNIFFLTDRNKKDTGVTNENVQSRVIKSVSVIGAGIMGSGIAAANIKRDVPLTLSDANHDVLERGVAEVLKEVSYNKKTKTNDVDRVIQLAPLLNGTQSDQEIATSDLVIEAIVENADVKKRVYARLEPLLGPQAILASNTSTLPITGLAENLKHPDRFCGIHFFNPVRRMKLVEIIRGAKTSDETIATAVNYAKKIGKSPIVVNDGPGFLVNRLLLPYMNESLELLAEGASIPDIERAAKSFGMPMGPLTLYDVVGLDTALYAGRTMWEAFPDRIGASPILPALVKAGRLGQKSGTGFFSYQNKKKRGQPDPELDKFIASYMKSSTHEFSIDEITHRLFLPMLLEATRVLQDRIVRDVRDVDLGLIFGLGFPPFKGGLLHWADGLGAAKIIELLKPFASLEERMKPTPLLEKMAAENQRFYELKL